MIVWRAAGRLPPSVPATEVAGTNLAACGLSVECNPVRAGLCEDPEDYSYSSARKYFRDLADGWVDDYNASALPPALQSLAQLSVGPVADALFAESAAIGTTTLSP